MYYALTVIGKVAAERGLTGVCPHCNTPVIPKCGEINVHHWAHKSLSECDTWSEGETDWHLKWKSYFPPEYTEVTVVRDGIKHRADLRLSTGWIVEFQNSPISIDAIRERNEFWGKVIWIFNAHDIYNDRFEWSAAPDRLIINSNKGYDTFKWLHAKRSLSELTFFVLDFGVTVFMVKKAYFDESPVRGWGYYRNKNYFLLEHLGVEREWASVGINKRFNWKDMTFTEINA